MVNGQKKHMAWDEGTEKTRKECFIVRIYWVGIASNLCTFYQIIGLTTSVNFTMWCMENNNLRNDYPNDVT